MTSVPVVVPRANGTWRVGTGRRDDEEGGEEEAEIWAALERLPTYDRLRTTIVERALSTRREHKAVQVKDVDLDNYISNQLFKLNHPEVDNEKFLSKLRKRIDDAGVEVRTVEVRYENVKVEGNVHIGSRSLPTLFNTVINFVEMITVSLGLSKKKTRHVTILEGVTGILKPGRLALLLGPPGSGKTTFLLALAGQLERDLKCEGTVEYNGYKLNEFEPRKTAAYISQNDLHQAELTVRETIDFSARCQGVGSRLDLLTELLRKEKEKGIKPKPDMDYFMKATAIEETSHQIVTEYILKIMGLDICADTIVGSQMIRGISGGQRKRLTTAEMIAGPVRALFMDEISTGLDSSTTYQVVKCIGQLSSIFQSTILISLLQPAPETYELFDDVILLSGGRVVYHGPLENVEEFFAACGFSCPKRKSIPDYLQEVTSPKDQEQYWANKSIPYKFVPIMVFEEKFKEFHVARKMHQELATPFDRRKEDKAMSFGRWSLPQWDLFKIVLDKEIMLTKKNRILVVFGVVMVTLISLIIASVFFRTERHHRNLVDAQQYAGALFLVVNQVVLMGYRELTFTVIRFPVFHKQRELQAFPPWTWALSLFLIRIPFSILESFACLISSYYLIGFDPAAARFFKLWLILVLGNMMMSALFRLIAALCKTYVVASSLGGATLIALFTLGGYVIPRQRIKKWLVWGYWVAPLSYVENAVMNNEFLSPRWRTPLPGDKHTLGQRFILQNGLFPYGYWYWMVCGILLAYAISFNLLFAAALTFLGAPQKTRALTEAQLAERGAQLTGEGLEKSATPTSSMPRSITSLSKARLSGAVSKLSSQRRPAESSRDGVGSSPHCSSSENDAVELGRRGMILPFQPLAISFRDISYYVDMPVERKKLGIAEDRLQLLSRITGAFRPGILTALVGVTGAGKSTLMDVLAGRKNRGYVTGDIRISGYPKNQETFVRIAGYCEQNDIHSPAVTVHESLIFSAWLRLFHEIEDDSKTEVMDLVELTPLKDALVGSPGVSGLSTEQRKRLTIAVELVANPSIIFMDEPTSGLDARAAATVMRAVRNTVDTGRTVVCTIHQPSIDIFDSFDEVVLLKRGGRVVYAGPLGQHCAQLIEYFQGIPGVPPIKEGINAASWMLEVSTPGMEEKLGVDFADLYQNSDAYERTQALVDELSTPPPNTEDLSFPTKFSQSVWKQFTCCLWKNYWSYWRSPQYNVMRIVLSLFCALFFGTLFFGMGKKLESQSRVYSLMGSIATQQSFFGIMTSTAIQPLISASRTVFYRERCAGFYSEFPYAIAQCVIELPFILTTSVLYGSVSYGMIKLSWTADKFLWYIYFFFCSQITFSYLGMLMVVLTPSPPHAAILANLVTQLWSIFNGFIIAHPDFPKWWRWAYWADPVAYQIYGTLVSQFGDVDDVYAVSLGGTRMSLKQLLKRAYGYKHDFLWFIGPMSILFPMVFALLFVISIKFLNYQQR